MFVLVSVSFLLCVVSTFFPGNAEVSVEGLFSVEFS